MLIIFLLIAPSTCQFASYLSLRLRLSGRCKEGDFDCGLGHCIPVRKFHDGRADCLDGSDEWCLLGQIRCGAYCVDFKDSLGCIFNPKCDGSTRQPKFCEITKEKLCRDSQAFPCKGYGECILWQNLMDGRPDCIDGSDEDAEYVRSLEFPFRCYFNRTGQQMPPLINYPSHPALPPAVAPVLTTQLPRLPLVPAIPPPCARCPPPFIFPPLSIQPTAHPPSFPTLLPVNQPDSQLPISPLASFSTISPVQIQHITPISVTQAEPGYGDFFPEGGSTASPNGYPPVVDFTVEAHINTVLPPTSASPIDQETSQVPPGWTTEASAHIKVIPSSGESGSQEPTHIDLGTGEVSGGAPTSSTASSVSPTPPMQPLPKATTVPSGPVDGIFFPIPVRPIPNGPVAIRPVPPFGGVYTLRPIVPEMTSPGPLQFSTLETDHLIPIHPGVPVPTAPGEKPTTPKDPFTSDEDYGGDLFPIGGPTSGPTVQVGVIPIGGGTTSPSSISSAETTSPSETVASISVPEEGETEAPSASTTTEEGETTTEAETTTTTTISTVVPVGTESGGNETTCPTSLLDSLKERYSSPFCKCNSDIKEECDRSRSTIFRIDKSDICKGDSSVGDEDKARVVLSMMGNSLPYTSCIDSDIDDGIIVSTNCSDCSLQLIQSKVEANNKEVVGAQFEALNGSICDSNLNNCHRYAVCVVDPSGLHFHCTCKKGTEDHSDGRGLDCFGFPAEEDCILIFGVCLIVWLLFLLGLLFCCPLVAFLCYRCSVRYTDNIVHPVTPGVKTVHVGEATPPSTGHKLSSNGSGTTMASVLVDALRNNAKGMTAVSHSMASRVRFTDEVTAPPGAVDWRPASLDKSIEPPPQPILKTGGMTSSSSEPKLSPLDKIDPLSGITAMEYLIKQGSPVITPRDKAETPTGAPGETPILEQIRTPIDTSRGTPPHEKVSVHSLPIPTIEVPGSSHKTSLDLGQMTSLSQPAASTPIVVTADVHQEKGDTHSVVSIGIQPTIWETYRAVGLVGDDDKAREDSSSSLDDLIGKKFPESRPATSVGEAVVEGPVPKLDLVTSPKEPVPPSVPPQEAAPDTQHTPKERQKTPVSVARKKSSASLKLAEMLGVTVVDDENDMQALTDMAEKKIELPLEPIAPTESVTSKLEKNLMSLEPIIQKTAEDFALEATILREKMEEEKKKDEASQVSAKEEEDAKPDLKKVVAESEPKTTEPFVPKAARKMPPKKTPPHLQIPPRRRAQESSTESSSEAETAMRRRMGREPNPFKDQKRRYRRPERQLSSISEKSGEIAGDAAISESSPDDFTVSLPNTTRSLSDWHAYIPRYKRFDATTTDTDPDIPHRYKKQPIVSSPEIPDVSIQRSQERLDMLESGRGRKIPIKQIPSKPGASSSATAGAAKPFLPQLARRSTSRSSVDSKTRASAVSRKIASRKTEMRPAKSASDLMVEEEEVTTGRGLVSKRQKIARSEEFLHGRPAWDISPYRDGDERSLPPLHQKSSYSMRAMHASPALKKRTGSRSSIRSGSSVSFSPYFDPRDPSKPPKEELWWTPRDS